MFEIDGHGLDLIADAGNEVFATLVYQPRSHKFHAARKALHALGAVYRPELRAWQVVVSGVNLTPLRRLYARTSMALWVIEDGDEISPESFERYQP